MSLRFFVVAAFVFGFFAAAPAEAQFFRNNAFTIKAGWLGLGDTFDGATDLKLWNAGDQGQVGAGYNTALGYNLWLDGSAFVGIGYVRIPDNAPQQVLFSYAIDTGLRYNFLNERVRPFVSGHLQYLQIMTSSVDIPRNDLFGGSPFWVGARAGGGVELFHVDNQSFMLEATLNGYFGANVPPDGGVASIVLPAAQAQLSYQIYF
jgi:hypothetical protein